MVWFVSDNIKKNYKKQQLRAPKLIPFFFYFEIVVISFLT